MTVDPVFESLDGQVSLATPDVYRRIYNCIASPVGGESSTLRLVALGVILLTNSIFGSFPLVCRCLRLRMIYFYTSIFSGGSILAAGLVHLLPEANANLANPCLGLSGTFPWAFTVCGGSLLITFGMRFFSMAMICRIMSIKHDLGDNLQTVVMLSEDFSAYVEQGINIPDASPSQLSIIQRTNIRDQKVASISLEAGILIQSFLLGINQGITSASFYPSTFTALIFQQGLVGLALGSAFVKAHFSAGKYYLLLGAFVLTTPVGIGLGIGLSNSYQINGKLALAFQGIFSAISAGIMMYHSLVDILRPAFSSSMLLSGPLYQRYAATLCVCLGFAAMALLVKWF